MCINAYGMMRMEMQMKIEIEMEIGDGRWAYGNGNGHRHGHVDWYWKWKCMTRRDVVQHRTALRIETNPIGLSLVELEWERDDDDDDDITSSSIELPCGGAQLTGGRNKCQDFPNRQIKLKTRPNGKSQSLRLVGRILQRMDGHMRYLQGMIDKYGKDYPDKQWGNKSIWEMRIPEMHITCWSYLCHAPVWVPGTNDWWLTSVSLCLRLSLSVCVCASLWILRRVN